MKLTQRTFGIVLVLMELLLTSGCVNPDGSQNNTGTGALIGGAIGALAGAAGGGRYAGQRALFGAAIGAVSGAIIGNMIDQQQQQRLREQSPQTLQKIQHNDAAVQQQQQAVQAQPSDQAPPPANVTPITVADVKALTSAGVKPDAIKQEIEVSKATFSAGDIAVAQQANVDPAVIECMKTHSS
jgi:outer membrane lipoprotein SlyB